MVHNAVEGDDWGNYSNGTAASNGALLRIYDERNWRNSIYHRFAKLCLLENLIWDNNTNNDSRK
jgi:hypothetical protein